LLRPQIFGGAQAEVWHGADGHPLIERFPMDGREGLVRRDSWSLVRWGKLGLSRLRERLGHHRDDGNICNGTAGWG
jgi:hypothetical protein